MSIEIEHLQQRLETLRGTLGAAPEEAYPDERFSFIACEEAFFALREGNYGVGCVLVGSADEILMRGHNRVFYPYFRSEAHAEMEVMNAAEDRHRDGIAWRHCVLYCSLEPCPMCLARLIVARVGTVRYVAPDSGGGMANRTDALPVSFRNLAKGQTFAQARCSPEMRELASQVFLSNLQELRQKLFDR